ncbi:hypothetical protein ACFL08_01430 [Patescibacteria group bacterium]
MIYKNKQKNKIIFSIILSIFILTSFVIPDISFSADTDTSEITTDLDYYTKYEQYLKYRKYKNYTEYKKYKDKYGFKNSGEKRKYKSHYTKYKKYKKNRSKYPQYAQYYDDYKRYKKYKSRYVPLKKYAKYSKYKKYKKNKYKKYGAAKYRRGHNRYEDYLDGNTVATLGEANLGGGLLGPEISVGLWSYSRNDLEDTPFKIKANKSYNVRNHAGGVIAQIPADTITRVTYDHDGRLKVYNSVPETLSSQIVYFDAVDGDNSTLIFDAYRPSSSFDQYRGKMQLKYHSSSKDIWVINTLPLEHYVWGMGEITGTGDEDYNRVMTTSFRTYGYWKIKFSTKYASEGFKVNATPGNQLYYGYDWETAHTRIKAAARDTQGHIVMYREKIAITPYSSWTDGRTRSFESKWGSSNYPWCQSVSDPYGQHPTKTTSQLTSEGNHMVGLSANGALTLARDHGWSWVRILSYYFTDITILRVY